MVTVDERTYVPPEHVRQDRRKRHNGNPTTAVTVNMDVATLERVDDYVVSTNGTRSGIIRIALIAFLDERDRERAEPNGTRTAKTPR